MSATVWIDGVDVTSYAIEGSSTRRLNRPSQAEVRLPLDAAIGGAGSKLKIAFDEFDGVDGYEDGLHFHGFVLLCETEADEDVGYVTYNATDVTELWGWRPLRDVDGDYTAPDLLIDFPNAPTIIEQMILNSEDATASADNGVPDGPLFLEMGQFPLYGVDVSGAPVGWPMTMAEIATLLCSTGELDVVIHARDSGGNMGRIDTYHGDYGTDRTGEVIFEFATGARNIRSIRHVEDMSNMANKLRYLLGPRVGTRDDPDGDQHWASSIDGDFAPVTQARQDAARATFGTRFDIKIWDGDESKAIELWRRLWNIEAWLRSWPMRMTTITPTRNTEIGGFDIGDLITVNAPLIVERPTLTTDYDGVGSVQRIYAYTISWDDDSVLELSELEASPSQEGYGQ
jgi:hypothetical protein